ncbi:antichymotrypsin-2-like [Diachasmimorpha longicaudata]|uniref:antichymotrypsin-2-like n=1 Tax=Diachasmimorpha longicaudata TaxID=58733 RepID=UPI0030B90B76
MKDAMNDFALNLYKTTLKEKSENFVASPFGAYFTLALVAYGARGPTMRELWDIMHLPYRTPDEFTKDCLKKTMNMFKDATDVTLLNQKKLLINEGFIATRQYEEMLRDTFEASIDTVNFASRIKTAETINNWAKEVSENRISEMVTSETLDPYMVLMLANVLSFSGEWLQPFERGPQEDFHVSENVVKSVPMMTRYGDLLHGDLPALKAHFIQLPYKNGNGAEEATYMYIIMPVHGNDFAYLEENISSLKLDDLQQGSVDNSVVYVPSFKMDTTLQLAHDISRMGAPTAFSEEADFTEISARRTGLTISNIVQRISLAVDKISPIVLSPTSNFAEMVIARLLTSYTFSANRPFLMVIATKDLILFTGKVVDPTQ